MDQGVTGINEHINGNKEKLDVTFLLRGKERRQKDSEE